MQFVSDRMAAKKKRLPQRTCIACRQVKTKRDLIRIVRNPEQGIIVDETGKAHGRGAYLCKDLACWQRALAQNSLARALKGPISAEDDRRLKEYAAKFT